MLINFYGVQSPAWNEGFFSPPLSHCTLNIMQCGVRQLTRCGSDMWTLFKSLSGGPCGSHINFCVSTCKSPDGYLVMFCDTDGKLSGSFKSINAVQRPWSACLERLAADGCDNKSLKLNLSVVIFPCITKQKAFQRKWIFMAMQLLAKKGVGHVF